MHVPVLGPFIFSDPPPPFFDSLCSFCEGGPAEKNPAFVHSKSQTFSGGLGPPGTKIVLPVGASGSWFGPTTQSWTLLWNKYFLVAGHLRWPEDSWDETDYVSHMENVSFPMVGLGSIWD